MPPNQERFMERSLEPALNRSTVAYDAAIIVRSASLLYRRANTLLISYACLGVLLGLVVGVVVARFASELGELLGEHHLALVTAVFGGLFGFLIGREKGYALKLRAQTLLCNVQIEQNTRP